MESLVWFYNGEHDKKMQIKHEIVENRLIWDWIVCTTTFLSKSKEYLRHFETPSPIIAMILLSEHLKKLVNCYKNLA